MNPRPPPLDPGFAPMTLDLLASVLSRAGAPSDLAGFLAESIRELTGAACVIVTDEAELPPGEPPRITALNPERRLPWLASAAGAQLLALARTLPSPRALDAAEGSPLGEALRAEGFALSLVVPLLVGDHRVGTILVLGDPDADHAGAVLALLDMLSTVVALVARNALLFERQEQVIAARTRELSEANEALRVSRDRLRLALAGTHFVWDWDLERGVLTAERDWAEWRGEASHVVRGSPREIYARIVHPDDLEVALARLEAHVRGETPLFESEHRVVVANGSVRWVTVRGRATSRGPDGRARRLAGVVTDVTERRLAQAQLLRTERLASLGTLAAGVAHEINNPLAYVQSNLAFVAGRLRERGQDDPAVASALADALDGAGRVREVVSSLQAFSHPGSGAPEPVDLEAELRAAVRLAENVVRHRARLEVAIGPLPRVVATAHQLGQVFVNLLVNAAQAIPPGGEAAAIVRVAARTTGDGLAEVEVRDTGVGIPAAALPRIFEPFFTTKPQGVGTGLGLSISHGIVTAAGGTIAVESVVGRGTVVRVALPPASPPGAPAGAAATSPAPPSPPARRDAAPSAPRRRLLIVDDEPAVARAARRLLERQFEVTVLNSPEEALAAFERGAAWDAVLCDLMMPGLSGEELFERTRRLNPGLAERFIFLTGGAFTPEAQAFLADARRPWAEKPFDDERLRALVAETAG